MENKEIFERILAKYNKNGSKCEIVSIDVSKSPRTEDLIYVDSSKVSRKNKPTFHIRTNDCLFKVKPKYLNEQFNNEF